MKRIIALAAMLLVAIPGGVAASPEKDSIKAVKQGEDLNASYPGAISEKEVASLRRVARCAATNLMKQKEGYFTVVWDCGSKGALGMRVVLQDGKITSVSTMEVGMRPNTGTR